VICIFVVEVENHRCCGIRSMRIASTFTLAATTSTAAAAAARTRRFIACGIGVLRHRRHRGGQQVHGCRRGCG
jgi:hypothetical protein